MKSVADRLTWRAAFLIGCGLMCCVIYQLSGLRKESKRQHSASDHHLRQISFSMHKNELHTKHIAGKVKYDGGLPVVIVEKPRPIK